jgi:hypothetical protein
MNPFIQLMLAQLLPLVEKMVEIEGPVVLQYLKDELDKLAAKQSAPKQ